MKKNIILIGTAIIIVAVGAVVYRSVTNGNTKSGNSNVGQYTRMMKVIRGDLNVTVSANGVVQPINKVEIKSKASGQIVQLNFEEGQEIEKGTLLLLLDQKVVQNDYDQSKADLAVGEANLSQAENNNNRTKELFAKSLVSEQERDQANVDYVRAKAQLVKAKAALSSAEERLLETKIVAPITGTILTRNVELGQIIASGVSNVSGGTLLATIADMRQVYVETYVDEVDIGRVEVGQQAQVIADAYPEDRFRGEVVRIASLGKTQQNVTTFTVIVLVTNIGGKLKAGMSASIDIEVVNKRNVLLIPNDALVDPASEQGRKIAEEMKQNGSESDSASLRGQPVASDTSAGNGEGFALDPSRMDWSQMRERLQKMSPEEREKMRQEFRRRFASMGGGPESFRRRGQSSAPQVRWRYTYVKDSSGYVPHRVKVGATNYDFTEVLEGLNEGDEVQAIIVSRALVANERRNEMMRSMQSVGGAGSRRIMR